eukprot:TRINITY_DN15775_c0_g1_i1.p1 TRINITY_DN15775_c0_g1~~TRINITY_DN15775_c0_g1_i1.p1  ORF type:complete len:469 (-),score=160.29 TRINITY_DN15775_c0_g1_i1:147-1553(-)
MKVFRSSNVIINNEEMKPANIYVSNGKITKIDTENYHDMILNDLMVYDYGDLVIMPGIVDSHVHVNDPTPLFSDKRIEFEGFVTATKAASAGGVTTVIDMPLNSYPPTTSKEAYDVKIEAAKNTIWTDVGFLGGIVPGNIKEIEPLITSGVCGFKAFMINSGYEHFKHCSTEEIEEGMKELRRIKDETGKEVVFMFHAELQDSKPHLNDVKEEHNGCSSYDTFLSYNNKESEDDAIQVVIDLCRKYEVRCHIVHLSSSNGIDLIRTAKEEGVLISAETTFNYLFFDSSCVKSPQYKCCPPIREANNQDRLWEGLRDGVIEQVISDHSPSDPILKEVHDENNNEEYDYLRAWGGISSVQFGLNAVWTKAKTKNFTLIDITKWMCEGTAKLVNLDHVKGKIAAGYDADFVIFDPNDSFVVEKENLHFLHKATPYLDLELAGVVHKTILRGNIIYDRENLHSIEPLGKMLI